jgi:L-threonylcarbamoyladenylate synthase
MIDYSGDVEACLDVLRRGGVIAYPTDTIWGLGCDATNEAAVERIFEIKKRPAQKSVIVLLSDARELIRYVAHPDPAVFDFLEDVQRPTTIVFEAGLDIAAGAMATDGSVAIRIPDDPFCNQLLKRFKKPLVSTSANFSGTPPPANFSMIEKELLDKVDYVVRYRQDDATVAQPSSVIRWKADGTYDVLRP